MTKKQKKNLAAEKDNNSSLRPKEIKPLTINQKKVFEHFPDNNLFLYGLAGTGKTFLALYLSLEKLLNDFINYEKIIIVKSAVPSRDIGFLPGSLKEKIKEYETPYEDICAEIFNRKDAYSLLKNNGKLIFTSTSFNRGITFHNSIIIVDECQNLNAKELNTIATRVGKNCKIIFAGDIRQCDLKDRSSGILDFIKIIQNMSRFKFVEFTVKDIVRSEFVKEYLITRTNLEDAGVVKKLY